MACPYILSNLSHLHMYPETTWGTKPTVSANLAEQYMVPVLSYGVQFAPQFTQSEAFIGSLHPAGQQKRRGHPTGAISAPMFGWFSDDDNADSLGKFLYDWAFADLAAGECERPSMTAEWAEGPDLSNRRHLGLRVGSATLSGSVDSGFCQIDLNVDGRTEETFATAETVPTDLHDLSDFNFADASLVIGGNTIDMESFELTVDYSPDVRFGSNFSPSTILTPSAVYNFSFTQLKGDDTYNALERASSNTGVTGTLVIKGAHDGTGAQPNTNTVLTVTMNNMLIGDISDDFPRGGLVTQTVPYALLPSTSANPITSAWTTD